MNELLGMMTVVSMMLGSGQKVTGPIPCEKQVNPKIDALLLEDENGRLGENFTVEKTETGVQAYIFDYKIHGMDGSQREHAYHIKVDKSCSDIEVKRI